MPAVLLIDMRRPWSVEYMQVVLSTDMKRLPSERLELLEYDAALRVLVV